MIATSLDIPLNVTKGTFNMNVNLFMVKTAANHKNHFA